MMKKQIITLIILLVLITSCSPEPKGKCGDGICDPIEKNLGKCSADCQETKPGDVNVIVIDEDKDDGQTGEDEEIEVIVTDGDTPVYVTLVSHNERTISQGGGRRVVYADMRNSKEGYKKFRDSLIRIADMIDEYGMSYSYQTDYMFLEGMDLYEDDILEEESEKTNGKRIYEYLESLGVSIEPHAHECMPPYTEKEGCGDKKYNYADLAYRIKSSGGVDPNPVVGGSGGKLRTIQDFAECLDGISFDYKWCPEIFTVFGGESPGHRGSDDYTSGIWNPKSITDFYNHDSDSKITYVGSGMLFDLDFVPVQKAIDALKEQGIDLTPIEYIEELITKTESGKIYTASIIFVEASMINQDSYDEFEDTLERLKELKQQGKIIPVTYPEAVDIWKTEYNSQPNMYTIDNFGGSSSADESIGFLGCSVTMNAMKGYSDAGGTKFWTEDPDYPGGDLASWASDLTDNSKYWSSFQSMADTNSGTEKIWWMMCAKQANEDGQTYSNALKVVNEVKDRIPNAEVYVSVMPNFPDHECSITGSDYYDDMQAIVGKLAANGAALEGPEMGPLTTDLCASDGCHANSAGEELLGEQLIDFFGKGTSSGGSTDNGGISAGLCGDGTCDQMEQSSGLCPADCDGSSSGGTGPSTDKCGDGTCDEVEQNLGLCPADCG